MPRLARAGRSSGRKRPTRFTYQENVKFHDGHPLPADDVIFSITKFHSELSRRPADFANIKEPRGPNPHTLVLTLATAVRAVHSDVRRQPPPAPSLPKHIYDGTDSGPIREPKPIGTVRSIRPMASAANFHRMKASTTTGCRPAAISTKSSTASSPTARAGRCIATGQVQLHEVPTISSVRLAALPPCPISRSS